MSKRLWPVLAVLALALALVGAACGGGDEGGDDLLAAIEEKGTLTVSTDPAYPPQSELNPDTNQYEGFDIDVATEIAERLGVEIAWQAPAWETIISGSWNGRWDISVGSMTITPERAEVLHFTPPYYFTPAAYAVHKDNTTITDVSSLNGKTIGACGGCTYDLYLQDKLNLAEDESGEPVKIDSMRHRSDDQDVRHRLDRDPRPRARRREASRRGRLRTPNPAGGDRRRHPDQDRAAGSLLRAPVGGRRPQLAARSDEPRRSDLGDRRGDARRRHASRAVGEVVQDRPHRRSAQGDGVS